ncbi:hypothetical protein LCI18_010709 [Fusarium solani-melongenae]|uniref:Uncharacterized protein n=1 Tax=Fusarium solani subsp. cucurbitae TaxID=2747967 RepID=A0ACD3ZEL6_FUSSC|nr:hypothetical protein LCI18_010709 [Fusarium solani-melongenae]
MASNCLGQQSNAEFLESRSLRQDIITISLGNRTKIVARQGCYLVSCVIDSKVPNLDTNSISQLPFTRIPLDEYCPVADPAFESGRALGQDQCIKRPRIEDWIGRADWPKWAELSLREIKVYEVLKQHPHPNIGRYFGCITEEGRVIGLCIEKGTSSLAEKLFGATMQQKMEYYNAVEAGVLHLHEMGLSHNELAPANIRMNGEVPFITNFAYCTRGAEVVRLQTGTLLSECKYFERDLKSLEDLRKYIFPLESGKPKYLRKERVLDDHESLKRKTPLASQR